MRRVLLSILPVAAMLAGCTAQSAPRTVAAIAPPPPVAVAQTFTGYGNLIVPPRLADGSYVTPNRVVSPAAAIWHLRAGLNVAALSCRGPEEAALIAGYNGLLQRQRVAFDQAYRAVAREHGGNAAFDAAMTTLYNYYALPAAQPGLCAAAQRVLAEAALLPADGLATFAPAALASLDRSYTTIFAAQDAWLASLRPRANEDVTIIAAVARAAPLTIEPVAFRK